MLFHAPNLTFSAFPSTWRPLYRSSYPFGLATSRPCKFRGILLSISSVVQHSRLMNRGLTRLPDGHRSVLGLVKTPCPVTTPTEATGTGQEHPIPLLGWNDLETHTQDTTAQRIKL